MEFLLFVAIIVIAGVSMGVAVIDKLVAILGAEQATALLVVCIMIFGAIRIIKIVMSKF